MQTVTIFSNDVGMDLGINKIMSCACKVHFQKISMEDCIILEELSLVEYLRQSKERLLKSAWRSRNCSEVEHPNDYKSEKKARGNSEGLVTERAPWAIHTVYDRRKRWLVMNP